LFAEVRILDLWPDMSPVLGHKRFKKYLEPRERVWWLQMSFSPAMGS